MSFKTMRLGQSFESVAKGATAVTRLPIGLSYEKIIVPFSGVTLDEMTEARLVANGETIRTWRDLNKLDVINQFDGMGEVTSELVFQLNRVGLLTRAGRELTKIGTGAPRSESNPNPITTLSLEIDIDMDAANSPILGVPHLHQDVPMPTGPIIKSKMYNYDPTQAGVFEIADLPKGELINRIFFFTKKNAIKKLEVERDNFIAFTRTKSINELIQREGVRKPQDGLFVFDPTEEGLGSEGLPTHNVQDLRFRLDMAEPDKIEVLVETISLLKA